MRFFDLGGVKGVLLLLFLLRRGASSVCFELELSDSGGDGWNGATYEFGKLDDGVVVAKGTLEGGFGRSEEICLDAAAGCYRYTVTAGSAPAEVSWSFQGLSGAAPSDVAFEVVSQNVVFGGCVPTSAPTGAGSFADLELNLGDGGTVMVSGFYAFPRRDVILVGTRGTPPLRIVGSPSATFDGAMFTLSRRADLTLEDLTLQKGSRVNSTGGCLRAEQFSTVTLVRTIISNCEATDGGALFLSNSALVATDSTFHSNIAGLSAGAVALKRSTFQAYGSSFLSNLAGQIGGVASLLDGSTFHATHCTFQDNQAGVAGGVAGLSSSSAMVLASSSFLSNGALEAAGVASLQEGSAFEAENSTFHQNCGGRFGGVAVADRSTFSVLKSTFDANHAISGGVVVAGNESTCDFGFSTFTANKASRGGVASLSSSSWLRTWNSTFEANFALEGGVAYAVSKSTLTATGSFFLANKAANASGVAYVSARSSFNVSDCAFEANSAAAKGGGVASVMDGSQFLVERSTFVRNTAGHDGGVAIVSDVSIYQSADSAYEGNKALLGGVLLAWNSSLVTSTNCSYEANTAFQGGTAYAGDSSLVSVRNSSFASNRAIQSGAIVYVAAAGATELYNSKLRDHLNGSIRCWGTGTVYAAKLDLELTNGTFDVDSSCVAFLYQANNDGSREFLKALEPVVQNNLGDGNPAMNLIHWSYPCREGQWSSDGIEHGNSSEYEDRHGRTIDENNEFCDANPDSFEKPDCARSCQTCPGGKFLNFTLNRYLHLGPASCIDCPVGRYLEDDGSRDRWWLHDDIRHCVECPPGRAGPEPGAARCMDCAPGSFQPESGQTLCGTAEPGRFTGREPGATQSWPCAPGRFSVGGAADCDACAFGELQREPGQTQCVVAEPGRFVNASAATESVPCPPGTFSVGGSDRCEPCPAKTYTSKEGQASCRTCPAPMTTRGNGSRSCDACDRDYFWNSIVFATFEPTDADDNCEACCTRCEDICDVDHEGDCVRCDQPGAELETLDVERGWWRATKEALKVYRCTFDRACRGGASTKTKSQCFRGHVGALCGACRSRYDYDIARNRCARCRGPQRMLVRAGNLALVLLALGAALLPVVLLVCVRKKVFVGHWLWTCLFFFLKEHARGGTTGGAASGVAEDVEDEIERDEERRQSDSRRRKENRQFRKSLITKGKIIVAALQIASSTNSVLLQVRFPAAFSKVADAFGFLGIFLFDVGSFKCVFRWTYFEKLTVVTVAPFGLWGVATILYGVLRKCRGKLTTPADRREARSNVTYATLLAVYVALPSISTYVITYFSCAHFDRGEQRDLRVIAGEPSIHCTSARYRLWAIYDAIMIAIWPVGATSAIACLLWCNRHKLNPNLAGLDLTRRSNSPGNLSDDDPASAGDSGTLSLSPPGRAARRGLSQDYDVLEGFQRDRRRHMGAMGELAKLRIRNADESLKGLEFLFEEYEPRCFLFPVFEMVRRLFLSSVLAVFYPGSMQQLVVGLLGAMLSYVAYSYYEAYIKDDDDLVAVVAQGQLVLIYFAALAAYASDVSDTKQGVFSGAVFGAILVVILFASLLVAVYVILLDVIGYTSLLETYHNLSTRGIPSAFQFARRSNRSNASSFAEDERRPSSDNMSPFRVVRRTTTAGSHLSADSQRNDADDSSKDTRPVWTVMDSPRPLSSKTTADSTPTDSSPKKNANARPVSLASDFDLVYSEESSTDLMVHPDLPDLLPRLPERDDDGDDSSASSLPASTPTDQSTVIVVVYTPSRTIHPLRTSSSTVTDRSTDGVERQDSDYYSSS